jgi:hypothetical protein
MIERNSERVVFHVTPDASDSSWIVSRENADFRREFERKEDAEKFAKKRAQQQGLAQVRVHKKDGSMEYESTYGEDPKNIPG